MPHYEPSPTDRSIRGRGALAVHPTSGVAVAIDGVLWLLDATTGIPRHILYGADGRSLDGDKPFMFSAPVAAFTPDGQKLWVDSDGPLLLDLETFDRKYGLHIDYSWLVEHRQTFLESWSYPSQSVGSDGTLFWTGQSGITRALEPSGHVRWQRELGIRGPASLDGNGNAFWNAPAVGLSSADGAVMWLPQRLPEWKDSSRLRQVEGDAVRSILPVEFQLTNAPGVLGLSRLDGSLAGVLPLNDVRATAQLGGTLVVMEEDRLSGWSMTNLQEQWSQPMRGDVGPIANEATNTVWIATQDCRVSELDQNGTVLRWHQMDGEPMDQISRISNGILYVLSMNRSGLSGDEVIRPGDLPHADGSRGSAADYGCYLDQGAYCGLPIKAGPVFYLYAYRVD